MKYRKKPVEVEAIQWLGDKDVAARFMGIEIDDTFASDDRNNKLIIPTLESDMSCNHGDYIIKGLRGEFYPCKSDIFEQTYEPVNGDYKQNPQHMLG